MGHLEVKPFCEEGSGRVQLHSITQMEGRPEEQPKPACWRGVMLPRRAAVAALAAGAEQREAGAFAGDASSTFSLHMDDGAEAAAL